MNRLLKFLNELTPAAEAAKAADRLQLALEGVHREVAHAQPEVLKGLRRAGQAFEDIRPWWYNAALSEARKRGLHGPGMA